MRPTGQGAASIDRLTAPAAALAAQGHDVRIVMPVERSGSAGLHALQDQNGTIVDVVIPPGADVMVLQRVTLAQLGQAIPLIRARGIAVVVDMDDDLTAIDPRNAAWTNMHPSMGRRGHNWHTATQACMDADLVTVSTPALLRTYAPHGRGVVVPNCVPASYLQVEHQDSAVIGWAGSVASHPGDLPMVGTSIAQLIRDGREFLSVGDVEGIRTALGLDADPPTTGYVGLEQWPHAVTRVGVGIAPLVDTRFNAGKSYLKPLEMSACGVPWVASPRAEYQKFHRLGCGLLAERPRDWLRQLKRLTADPAMRADLSAAGRAVAADHTIEGNAWKWLAAWEQAHCLAQAARTSAA